MSEVQTLRLALEKMVQTFNLDQGGVIEHALFTTFNFDPGFFERNVLPLVCGLSAVDLQTMSVDAASRQMYYPLKRTKVVVAYDQAVMQGASGGGLRYVPLPKHLTDGFFHAKLVVLAGRDAKGKPLVTLMVGSGNMTLSGWADNIEVAAWVEANQQDAKELLGFYAWLDCEEALQPGKNILGEVKAQHSGHELFLQYSDHPQGSLFTRMFAAASYETMQIYSPYWSEEAVRHFSPTGSIACYPAFNGDKGYLFPIKREQLKRQGAAIELRAIKDEERFRHAKAYVWENHIAVGSANCTLQALHSQKNVEAMLRFDEQAFPGPVYVTLQQWNTDLSVEEEGIKPCPVAVLVIADYDRRCYLISLAVRNVQRCSEWALQLGDVRLSGLSGLDKEIAFASGNPVARMFRLEWQGNDGQDFISGMVIPRGGNDVELGYRPKRCLERIFDDMLRHRPGVGGGGGGGYQGEGDIESDDPELQPDAALFEFDMYGMYQSFFHLQNDVKQLLASPGNEAKHSEITDTLLEILHAVKEGEVSNDLQRWLIVQECFELSRLLDDSQLLERFSALNESLENVVKNMLLADGELQRYKISADDLLVWVRRELGYGE